MLQVQTIIERGQKQISQPAYNTLPYSFIFLANRKNILDYANMPIVVVVVRSWDLQGACGYKSNAAASVIDI